MAATLPPGAPKFIPRTPKPHPTAGCIEPEPETTEKAWQAAAFIAHNVVSTADGRPEVKLDIWLLCNARGASRFGKDTTTKYRIDSEYA